ncbi:MAG: AraC family transcriptional regulator, partial [Clostridia bacterium]|nr:AraC family transcriptional regulator [Clostridia bacterium]
WIDGMNRAMEQIEENLAGEIMAEQLAQTAACSVFHFQRMFTFITGVTLNEYIRRRRMTAAAFELLDGNVKVIDLALKYGYESPTAFNRAFQSVHGVAPSQARREGISLTAFPKLAFTLSIKGETAMNYRIIKKEAFRIVGFAWYEELTMENCFQRVPEYWAEFFRNNGVPRVCRLMEGKEPQGILGVSLCENGDYGGYFIAAATDAPVPEGMEEYIVPETTYAVFESIGPMPDAIQNLQRRIVSEWLLASGYEYAPAPDIEVYPAGDQSAPDYRCEVWLPIVKK